MKLVPVLIVAMILVFTSLNIALASSDISSPPKADIVDYYSYCMTGPSPPPKEDTKGYYSYSQIPSFDYFSG